MRTYWIYFILAHIFIFSACSPVNRFENQFGEPKTSQGPQTPTMSINEFESSIIAKSKLINENLPIKVDEITTLFCVINIGKSLMFKYEVDEGYEFLLDDEWAKQFKQTTVANLKASSSEMSYYMSKSSLVMKYLVYSNNGELIHIIEISSKDFKQ